MNKDILMNKCKTCADWGYNKDFLYNINRHESPCYATTDPPHIGMNFGPRASDHEAVYTGPDFGCKLWSRK